MAESIAARIAVLVDADNAKPSAISEVLAEVARYGAPTIKRAYGDWTTPNLSGWKENLHVHAVQPVQQFRYTKGKNATDSALIIDAMDILHAGQVDAFCLVSSDSDFTRLATRIREEGLTVYGIGEKKTPQPFVAACDKFVFTEILGSQPAPASKPKAVRGKLKDALLAAIAAQSREDGWASLGAVGNWLASNDPSFDARNHGYRKLSDLVRAQPFLEIDERPSEADTQVIHVYVRGTES